MSPLLVGETRLPLPLLRRGKVRDVYEVDDARLLLVASDRVSAFDVVMRELVPYKGAVLTQVTAWWLGRFAGEVENHLLTCDVEEIVAAVPAWFAPVRLNVPLLKLSSAPAAMRVLLLARPLLTNCSVPPLMLNVGLLKIVPASCSSNVPPVTFVVPL